VEVDSSLGTQLGDPVVAAEYEYRDGTWDPKERTFGAFGGGTEKTLGDSNTPTLLTESTFDTGIAHRVLRGSALTSEQRDTSGYIFSRTTNGYTTVALASSADSRNVEYGYKSSELVEHIEGSDTSAARTTLTEWVQDEFGNVTRESKWGEVLGSDKLAGNDEVITIRTFANNTEDWILGRVASEEVQDGSGHRMALRRSYYDGEAFKGLSLGQVARGDLRRVESRISGDYVATEAAFDHDQHGNVTAALDARGGRSGYDFDPESHTFVVAELRYPDDKTALVWQGTYDGRFGKPTAVTDPNGARVDLKYDALGRPTAVIKPGDSADKATVTYAYQLGAPLSTIRAEQREASGQDGTLVSITHVDGLGRQRGKLTESAKAGYWVLSDFVAIDARGNKSFVAFPSEERSADLPYMDSRDGTRTRYDALGRAIVTLHVDGSSSKVVYAPFERTAWDENDNDPKSPHNGTPTTYLSDDLARLKQAIEHEGTRGITSGSYAYDALGNVTDVTDANGTLRKYDYDGRSRRIGIHDPNAGDWQLFYTDGNDLERRVDPAGHVVRSTYDRLGRVTGEWHRAAGAAAETQVESYHYDAPSPEHPEYQNTKAELGWVEDAAGAVFFGYNARGLVSEKTRRWSDGKEHTTWNDYDAADRPIRRGYPNSIYLSLQYDTHGQLAALGPVVPEIQWTPHGALSSMKLGNGIVDARGYDQRRRLEQMTAKDNAGAALRDLKLTLDAASRVTRVDDLRSQVPAAESQTTTYTFDDRYRLTAAQDALATTTWKLDDTAKILSVESGHQDAWLNVTNSYGENGAGPDQLTHHGVESFAYDQAGRLTKDAERTFEWDSKGRVSRVTRGAVVEEYVYAYDDERVIKRTTKDGTATTVRYADQDVEERAGGVVRYVFVGDQRIARLDPLDGAGATPESSPKQPTGCGSVGIGFGGSSSTGSTRALLALISGLLLTMFGLWRRHRRSAWPGLVPRVAAWATCAAALSLLVLPSCKGGEHRSDRNPRNGAREITELPASAEFYLADWQNSPVVLADAKGQVTSQTAYHPYGSIRNRAGQNPDPWNFVGNERDDGTGLGDFHARPYRAELGMFLAPDPVGTFEVEKTLGAPFRLFAYSYGAGDPPNRVDRDGRWFESVLDVAFIGYDVYRIVKDNVIGKKDNLGTNMLALGADVVCLAAPAATGGGLAVRGGGKLLGKGGGAAEKAAVKYMYSGTKRTAQAQMKAEQVQGSTSRAARREAMREVGIPTSQQPSAQQSTRVPGTNQGGGRQYTYEVPKPGGGTQEMSVQHSLTDQVEGHGAHWEAGRVKTDPNTGAVRTDSLGRPKLAGDKVKINE
jgi:RHS repeat-associated protein